MKYELLGLIIPIAFSIVIYFILFFFAPSYFRDFAPEVLAVLLGLLIGFGIDRYIDSYKKERDKKDLLSALSNELKTIKGTAITDRIYPDIWDSAISSGKLSNLLNPEQEIELTKVYRSIRELDNERERVMQAKEDLGIWGKESMSYRRFRDMELTHKTHTDNLNKMIEKVLQDKELWE